MKKLLSKVGVILWHIWKEYNKCVFEHRQPSPHSVISKILFENRKKDRLGKFKDEHFSFLDAIEFEKNHQYHVTEVENEI